MLAALPPAAYDGVVAVAATEDPYPLWDGSTFGPWVDIAAPGVRILSTLHDGTSTQAPARRSRRPWWPPAGLALAAPRGPRRADRRRPRDGSGAARRVAKKKLRVIEASITGGFAICVWHVPANGTARKQVRPR